MPISRMVKRMSHVCQVVQPCSKRVEAVDYEHWLDHA